MSNLKPYVLKSGIIQCEHGGTVVLGASRPRFSVEDVPAIVVDDLHMAPISGCSLSKKKGGPCTHVLVAPESCGAVRATVDKVHHHVVSVADAQTDKGAKLCLIDPAQFRAKANETDLPSPDEVFVPASSYRLRFAWQQIEQGDLNVCLTAPRPSMTIGEKLYPDFSDDDDFPVFPDNETRLTTGLASYVHIKINGSEIQSYHIVGEDGMPLYRRIGQTVRHPIQTRCIDLGTREPDSLDVAFSLSEQVPTEFMKVNLHAEPVNDEVPLPYLRIGMRLPLKTPFMLSQDEASSMLRGKERLVIAIPSGMEQLLYRQQCQRQQFSAAVLHNHGFFKQLEEGHAHAYQCLDVLDNAYQTQKKKEEIEKLHTQIDTLSHQFWHEDFRAFLDWAITRGARKEKVERVMHISRELQRGLVSLYSLPFNTLLTPSQQQQWQQLVPIQAALDIQQRFIGKTRTGFLGFENYVSEAEQARVKQSHSLVLNYGVDENQQKPAAQRQLIDISPYCEVQFPFSFTKEETGNDKEAQQLQQFGIEIAHSRLFLGLLYEFYLAHNQGKGFELLTEMIDDFTLYTDNQGADSKVAEQVTKAVDSNPNLKPHLELADKPESFLYQYRHRIHTQQQLAYAPPIKPYLVSEALAQPEENWLSGITTLLPSTPELSDALFGEFRFYAQESVGADDDEETTSPKSIADMVEDLNAIMGLPKVDATDCPITSHHELAMIMRNYSTLTPKEESDNVLKLLDDDLLTTDFNNQSAAIKNLIAAQANAKDNLTAQLEGDGKVKSQLDLDALETLLFQSMAMVMPILRPVTQLEEERTLYWSPERKYMSAFMDLLNQVRELEALYWLAKSVDTSPPPAVSPYRLLEIDCQPTPPPEYDERQAQLYLSYVHYLMEFLLFASLDKARLTLMTDYLPTLADLDRKDPVKRKAQLVEALTNTSEIFKSAKGYTGVMKNSVEAADQMADSMFGKEDRQEGVIGRDSIENYLKKLKIDKFYKGVIKRIPVLEAYANLFATAASLVDDKKRNNLTGQEIYLMTQSTASAILAITSQRTALRKLAFNTLSRASFKQLAGLQKQLSRLLGGKVIAAVGILVLLTKDLNSLTEEEQGKQTVYVVQAAIMLMLVVCRFTGIPGLIIGFILSQLAERLNQSAVEIYVTKSLWHQNGREFYLPKPNDNASKDEKAVYERYELSLPSLNFASTAQLPYLHTYLAHQYPEQQPWLSNQNAVPAINEINQDASDKWISQETQRYFYSDVEMRDFLLANYLNPQQTGNSADEPTLMNDADQRRARLASALEYELRRWNDLTGTYHITMEVGLHTSFLKASKGLVDNAKAITLFAEDGKGDWYRYDLYDGNSESRQQALKQHLLTFRQENEVTSSDNSKLWWKTVVLACYFTDSDSEEESAQQVLYFRTQGEIKTVFNQQALIDYKERYGKRLYYSTEDIKQMCWEKGKLDAYVPTAAMKARLHNEAVKLPDAQISKGLTVQWPHARV